jgi:hypothetical protein
MQVTPLLRTCGSGPCAFSKKELRQAWVWSPFAVVIAGTQRERFPYCSLDLNTLLAQACKRLTNAGTEKQPSRTGSNIHCSPKSLGGMPTVPCRPRRHDLPGPGAFGLAGLARNLYSLHGTAARCVRLAEQHMHAACLRCLPRLDTQLCGTCQRDTHCLGGAFACKAASVHGTVISQSAYAGTLRVLRD